MVPLQSSAPQAQGVGRYVVALLLVAWFAGGLAYLALRHVVWPRLDGWRPQLVEHLSSLAGRPVAIGRLETGFEGLLPRLTAHDVTILDDDGTPALAVPRATAVLSPRTLFAGEPRLATLQLERPRLRVERVAAGRLRVAGIDVPLDDRGEGRALETLLAQRRIVLRDATLEWIDRERAVRETVGPFGASVGSVGRRHRATLSLGAHAGAWQRLTVALEVYRPAGSRPRQWERWSGELYAAADALDLSRVDPLLPHRVEGVPAAGVVQFRTWTEFDAGRLRGTLVKLAGRTLAWRFGGPPLEIDALDAEATLRAADGGHELRVQRLVATAPGGATFAALGEQRLRFDARWQPVGGYLGTGAFDVADAVALARRLPLERDVLDRLDALSVQGRVASLSARWTGAEALAYDVAVDFERLSLRYRRGARGGPDAAHMPWFANLSGQARFTHRAGELRIDAGAATLAFPGIFPEPAIPFDTLKGDARWTLDDDGDARVVRVDVDRLRFANADATGEVGGSYRTGGKGAGLVDLQARLERADAHRAVRYLPLSIPQPVRDWVASAISAGRSDDVRLRLRGDLEDFPFRRPEDGEFSVKARLHDTTLAYAPGWPAIERFDGQLLFERAGMKVTMRSGRVFGVTLGETEAVLADFGDPVLRIRGAGDGPADDMIRFVNQSPLLTRIDDFTRDASARGAARLGLKLELPLDDLDRTRVAGTVAFQGNELLLDRTVPAMSGVTGVLEFSEKAMQLRGIAGTFLGGPVRVDGETPAAGRFALRVEGTASAEGMRTVVDNPLTRALSGEAAYRAAIELRHRAPAVTIESDLAGLAAALPAPFGKAAGERWPLRVQTQAVPPADAAQRPERDTIRVELRDAIRLALERTRDPRTEKLLIRRGAFAVNAEPVLPEAGLTMVARTPEIDVDAWLALLAGEGMRDVESRASSAFGEGFGLLPDTVAVVASRVHAGGRDLNDVVLGATRLGGYWQANVAAREVGGFFNWREAAPGQRAGTLTARFTRLEVPRSRIGEVESLLDTPPDSLPGLDIAAEDFVLFGRRLGTLALRATNNAGAERPEWTLDTLRIAHRSASFAARGVWSAPAPGGARDTRLAFELGMADAGALLELYGIEHAVSGGAGTIAGELRWRGSPLSLDTASLGGTMALKIGRGRFLKTDPGIAKLIGVLNLQSLPRRLALDFSDVFAEGFAFDAITGRVDVERGVARTDDLAMRGVQAQVAIRGTADIAAETQSLEVEVRPELNAGLASLAYGAMVNPVVGIGSFVAQMALRAPIQQMFSYEYAVSGSWADPQVIEKRRRIAPSQQPTTTP